MDIHLTEDQKIKVLNSKDIYKIMQQVLWREEKIDQNKEHFWILGLANNNRLLFIELISLGSVNKTIVEPMEVFSLALQKQAVKIILCHNHPSGELHPSAWDKDITDRMIQVGYIVNTPVIDHLIITELSYLSFEDIGLMEELEQSTKYVPDFLIITRLKEQAAKILAKRVAEAKEKATRTRNFEIAHDMKKEGMELALIAKITGLTEKEVREL